MIRSTSLRATCLAVAVLLSGVAQATAINKSDYNAARSRADGAYKAESDGCKSLASNAKDICVKTAKAVRSKALADLQLNKDVAAARTDASVTKRDADYKVAAEKCEALAGDAKSACLNSAKVQFGKS